MGEDQVGLWWVSGGDRGKSVVGFGRSAWVILAWVSSKAWFKLWILFGVGYGVDICYPVWWKSVWSCGGCGVVIGFDGFFIIIIIFFLTWFCFWFDGPVVVLGYMRVVVCSLCCYFEVVWW